MNKTISLGAVSVAVLALAAGCGGDDDGGLGTGGSAGASGGSAGSSSGGSSGSSSGGSAGSSSGGSAGSSSGGSAGSSSGGSAGSSSGGSAGSSSGGSAGSSSGGSAGSGGSNTGGSAGSGGSNTGGSAGSGGSNTGGTGGGSGGASGGSGGTGGGPGLTCKQLESNYAASLKKAKSCSPILPVVQCTSKVDDELACPCPTFINPGNTAAAAELAKLKAEWKTQNCSAGVVCPLVLCAQPSGATCVGGSATNGSCVDNKN